MQQQTTNNWLYASWQEVPPPLQYLCYIVLGALYLGVNTVVWIIIYDNGSDPGWALLFTLVSALVLAVLAIAGWQVFKIRMHLRAVAPTTAVPPSPLQPTTYTPVVHPSLPLPTRALTVSPPLVGEVTVVVHEAS